MKKQRLDREIKRLVREKAKLFRQVTVDSLQKKASSPSLANDEERINNFKTATNEVCRLGDELKPRNFTRVFSAKTSPKSLIVLRNPQVHTV